MSYSAFNATNTDTNTLAMTTTKQSSIIAAITHHNLLSGTEHPRSSIRSNLLYNYTTLNRSD